tara:strand:- start:141 stop:1169 length:1029 start_codon:yes stop_codon:yes gene_type:complete
MKKKIIEKFLRNKTLLITGATGTLGKEIIHYLLDNKIKLKKLIIFSRDELKQVELEKLYQEKKYKNLRFLIGDIRDKERLSFSLKKVDFVIHAAALKHVPVAEYNPIEFIKTNIIGTQNLVEACIENSVSKVVSLSTDKASSPINLYGATKLCSDKLMINSNNITGRAKPIFSVVRYGNVFLSRGSVANEFSKQLNNYKTINVTDKEMTRFHIEISEAINLIFFALINSKGGELYVPILPSFKIIDLAKAFTKNKINLIGKREGEKIHEEMISETEISSLAKVDKYYIVLSNLKNLNLKAIYRKYLVKKFSYKSYNSQQNNFLSITDLKKLLKKYNLISKFN